MKERERERERVREKKKKIFLVAQTHIKLAFSKGTAASASCQSHVWIYVYLSLFFFIFFLFCVLITLLNRGTWAISQEDLNQRYFRQKSKSNDCMWFFFFILGIICIRIKIYTVLIIVVETYSSLLRFTYSDERGDSNSLVL